MAGDHDSIQPKAENSCLLLNCFGFLSAVIGVLQFISRQGSSGEVLKDGKTISLSMSISLIAFSASLGLPSRYSTICSRLCFFFSVLACAFLLSPFVHNKLFWAPYLACIFPLLHLLQLLPASLQQPLQQLWWATRNAIRDAACRAHHAIVRSVQALLPRSSSSITSNSNAGRSTCSSSSTAVPARIVEEGGIADHVTQ